MKRDINHLLKKYKTRTIGEIWSKKHNTQYIQEYRTKQKYFIFDGLNNQYQLKGNQKLRAEYIIKQLDFNKVNTQLTIEEIITMIALYVRTEYQPLRYYDYKYMLKNKNINEDTYITFLTGLNKNLASTN